MPAVAAAQPPSSAPRAPREGRIELSGGLRLAGPLGLGTVPATETATGGRTRTIFTSENSLEAGVGFEGRLGVMLSGAFQVEGGVSYTPTGISSDLSGDVDGAADMTADVAITQFTVDGGIRVRLSRRRAGGLSPFVTAGAGYLRHVYDGRTLIASGATYYAGGGVDWVWRASGRGAVKGAGLRADLRASLLKQGALLDDDVHISPVAGVGFFVMF